MGRCHRTRYTYDVLSRLTNVQDQAGNQTALTYDAFGRKAQLGDPDVGAWSYAYDAAGNLLRQTDAKSQTVCFYYDSLNRLKGKTYRSDLNCPITDPDYAGYTVKNYYDDTTYTYPEGSQTYTNKGMGRRTQMVDPSGSTQWVYDERGRVRKRPRASTGLAAGASQPVTNTTRPTG